MVEDEFERIWQAQAAHFPGELSENRRAALRAQVFRQRPLKPMDHLRARCTFIRDQRAAYRGDLLFQQFRIWQTLHNLRIAAKKGEPLLLLSAEQRQRLADRLEREAELNKTQIKDTLGLKTSAVLNLDSSKGEGLQGNITSVRMREALGGAWDAMSDDDRDSIVQLLLGEFDAAWVRKTAVKRYGISPDAAARLDSVGLFRDSASVSREAIKRLLPLMIEGNNLYEATQVAFPDSAKSAMKTPDGRLPALDVWAEKYGGPDVTNPGVRRSLTELRKVVNAIVAKWGLPRRINIELARDLRTKKSIQRGIENRNRNTKRRKDARAKVREQFPGLDSDLPRFERVVDKWMLYEECKHIDPYRTQLPQVGD